MLTKELLVTPRTCSLPVDAHGVGGIDVGIFTGLLLTPHEMTDEEEEEEEELQTSQRRERRREGHRSSAGGGDGKYRREKGVEEV